MVVWQPRGSSDCGREADDGLCTQQSREASKESARPSARMLESSLSGQPQRLVSGMQLSRTSSSTSISTTVGGSPSRKRA
eukprot:5656965-Prymnesium_polylepis.1